MEDYKKDVPYIVYESEAARHERTVKRLITALLITILLMVGTNMAWLYVFNQYDFTSTTTEITTDEGNTNLLEAGKVSLSQGLNLYHQLLKCDHIFQT